MGFFMNQPLGRRNRDSREDPRRDWRYHRPMAPGSRRPHQKYLSNHIYPYLTIKHRDSTLKKVELTL